jgi:hypothetical protein
MAKKKSRKKPVKIVVPPDCTVLTTADYKDLLRDVFNGQDAQLYAQWLTKKIPRNKRRNEARDKEIVQLRDEKKLTFGKIGKKIGLSRDATERAYYREKNRNA